MKFQKRPLPFRVEFARKAGSMQTAEGSVAYRIGDALLTGVAGERWPIRRPDFERTYAPVPPARMGEDGFYVKLALVVDALQAQKATPIQLDGDRGVLSARAGDWIVTGPDGDRWIVADDIFRRTYAVVNEGDGEDG